MNRKDIIYINKVKNTLKEAREIARKDADISTSPNDLSYYLGLLDGYAHAYELVRKLK